MNTVLKKLKDNELFSLIKDYSSFILLILSILGGAKQFAILFYYSPSLTQYFSVTQILIDGIGLLIKFCIFFIGIITYLYFFSHYGRLRHIFFFFILLTFCMFPLSISGITHFGFVLINVFIIMLLGMVFTAIYFKSKNVIPIDFESKYDGKAITILFFTFCILYIFFSEKSTNDIINVKTNTTIIRKEIPNVDLLYFNDQYLIYGVRSEEKSPPVNKKYSSENEKNSWPPRDITPPPHGPHYYSFYVQKSEKLFQ